MNLLKERIGDMIGLMSKNRLHKTRCFYLNVSKQHGINVMHSKNITVAENSEEGFEMWTKIHQNCIRCTVIIN